MRLKMSRHVSLWQEGRFVASERACQGGVLLLLVTTALYPFCTVFGHVRFLCFKSKVVAVMLFFFFSASVSPFRSRVQHAGSTGMHDFAHPCSIHDSVDCFIRSPVFKIKREVPPVSFFTSPDSLFTSSRLRFLQFNRVHLYMMSLPSFHLPCLHVFSFVVPCVSLISRDCVLIRIMFLSCSTSPWPRHETPKYTVIERNRYRTYGGVSVVGALSGRTMRNRLPARVRKMTNFGSGVPEDWNGLIGCLLLTRICS